MNLVRGLIIFEFSTQGKIMWKPRYFTYPIGGGRFRRVCWVIFSITLIRRLDLYDYSKLLETGKIGWRMSK